MWAAMLGDSRSLDAVQALLEAGADVHAVKPASSRAADLRRKIAEATAKLGLAYTPRTDPDAEPQTVLELARRHTNAVYKLIRDTIGGELAAYDQADTILSGLKTAASEPWFTQLADELAAKLKCKPQPWQRRRGVLHFSAKLSRLPKPSAGGESTKMSDEV